MIYKRKYIRIRVEYTKGKYLSYSNQKAMQRIWEDLLRSTDLFVKMTPEYTPRPCLDMSSALPLFYTSDSELVDFWIYRPCPLDEIQTKLSAAVLFPGLKIKSVQVVELDEGTLQEQMTASEFKVTFYHPQDESTLNEKVTVLLSREEIVRVYRQKSYDLRPSILGLEAILDEKEESCLWIRLREKQGAASRPDELLNELGYKKLDYHVQRTRIILSSDSIENDLK